MRILPYTIAVSLPLAFFLLLGAVCLADSTNAVPAKAVPAKAAASAKVPAPRVRHPLAVQRPFILPLAAKVVEHSADGKGWLESGIITVPFVQAEASFRAAMARSGWKYRHAVALGRRNSHALYTWHSGGRELTLMLHRIDVSRTSFAWGLAKSEK